MTNDAAAVARARSIAGLTAFVALLVILAFVVETLSQVGVSSKILVWLVAGFCLAVPAVVAIAARTISSGEFALAGRNVALGENAVTAATAIFGGVFAIAIAAASFRSEGEMSALVLGLCGGCLIAGILTAPYFRRSGCATPGDFLSARFGSRLLGAVAALVAASALFPMLVAQLSIAAMIAEWTLGIGRQPALVAAALLLLLPPLLGGMRGVTVTALVQFLLALIVFVVVGVWMSAVVTGSSLPPVAYAIAIAEPSGIEATANMSATAGAIWNDAGLTLCVALGVASFPALLIRSATARSSASARSSIAWTLFVVAIFCGCAATMAALAKFALDATVRQASPASLFDVAPWISHWVDRGATLVTICGQPAKDAIATIAACATKPFAPGDLAISPDIAMLAAPDIAGLPQLASMLLATACLASTLAAASLVLFAIGAALGHDLYFRGLEPRAPVSRRLLAQRLSLLLAIGLASLRGRLTAGRLSAARTVVILAGRRGVVPRAGACRLVEAGEPMGGAAWNARWLRDRRLPHRGRELLPTAVSLSRAGGTGRHRTKPRQERDCLRGGSGRVCRGDPGQPGDPAAEGRGTPIRRSARPATRFSRRRRARIARVYPSALISAAAPIMSRLRKARRAAASSSRPQCSMFQSSST